MDLYIQTIKQMRDEGNKFAEKAIDMQHTVYKNSLTQITKVQDWFMNLTKAKKD